MSLPDLGTSPLDDAQLKTLGDLVCAALAQGEADAAQVAALEDAMAAYEGPSLFTLRANGAPLLELEEASGPALGLLLERVADLAASLPGEPDSFEWIPSGGGRSYSLAKGRDWNQCRGNIYRGLYTLRLQVGELTAVWGPYALIKPNLRFRLLLDEWRAENGTMSEAQLRRSGRVHFFDTAQFVARLDADATVTEGPEFLFRGRRLTRVQDVRRAAVENLVQAQGRYLLNHVEADGRMHYLWFPGIGEDTSGDNNMIRQWMATIALCRFGHYSRRDPEVYETAERNIRFNLRSYYYAKGSQGFIEWDNRISLGSVALAAIALLEHPGRRKFSRPERKLIHTTQSAWSTDGSFLCQIKPRIKEHGINFYPGETLLLWSYLLKEGSDRSLMAKFMASFRYYRQHHLHGPNRQPAFVPWHTQAYFNVWEVTRDPELSDFVFEMNDWLVDQMQQWEGTVTPDTPGQFYAPKKPEYGTPHASSTGVYMEGLVDAWRLAKALGDEIRRERYRVALVRGTRSCMQQTFLHPVETTYCPQPDMVLGGTTTTVYNNRIRNDNVQHNLMALMKMLEYFEDAEFEHESWSWMPAA